MSVQLWWNQSNNAENADEGSVKSDFSKEERVRLPVERRKNKTNIIWETMTAVTPSTTRRPHKSK
jgi:hypothetical protein